jgi:hypothetical protein
LVESTDFTVVASDAGVLRAVVVKGPAERGGIKPFGFSEMAARLQNLLCLVAVAAPTNDLPGSAYACIEQVT